MARGRRRYRRQDSPYWCINVVLPDGRRLRQSTRLRGRDAATEFLIRLKADAYDAQQNHLRQLDPFLAELALNGIDMESLRPFIRHRREVGPPRRSEN